jgi:hypothetical protein
MAQTWTDDVYAADHAGQTDLQNMENNFQALKTNFSGASAPSGAVAGMVWYHTSKGLRIRNAGNSAWIKALQGDAGSKCWFYRNDTAEGWVVDTSVTDRVLAIKGGSQSYNVNGGNPAGTWTISGITVNNESAHTHGLGSHVHQWYDNKGLNSADKTYDYSGAEASVWTGGEKSLSGPAYGIGFEYGATISTIADAYTKAASGNTAAGSAHNHSLTFGSSWRPSAAVGTLQYPDLS